jgi:hypothetical protein
MSGWAKCSPCGLEFAYDGAFDAHRVGEHEYTYAEGLKLDPSREDGRRCLTVAEMIADGWDQDKHGRWRLPVRPPDDPILARVEL